jgi:hypothetical protein
LVGVVDGTGGIDNLDCDGGSGVDVDHPGVGRALLGGEVLESSGRWLATWNDGDVERSGSLTPSKSDWLALNGRSRSVDSECLCDSD